MSRPTRPILRYHGGKWRLAPWVLSHFPAHNVYVEPFGGAASVLLQKTPVRIEVYNDVDELLVSLFRILRDPGKAEALRRLVQLTPFARAEFAKCWTQSGDELEDARRLIVRSFQAIGAKGTLQRNGWRTRTSKSVWSPCLAWNGWPEQMPEFVDRLRNVIIECLDWSNLIKIYDAPDALFYIDPPYPRDTRDSGHRTIYAQEMSDADHHRLIEEARQLKGMVAISSYANPIYGGGLADWMRVSTDSRAQTNSPRVECLWLNPAITSRLQPGLNMEVA